ncbi:CAP domain-containing protein [Streptomyces sp. YS415]|uniref:CAP domain-containing protein n=1 Tax=Streptomyces sp. YS415 TaxID=2944806 RepID=UPI0020225851|nr:CAP domain-containing protein [Streptomyces sp. YS415]MCL7429591.1 CAP domain-containing protein [Streptomyces sp. YS415]
MSELVPGGNVPLPGGAVAVRVPGPFDVSALITDDGGKVGGDGDFVFYNQPAAPGARLHGDTLTVDPARLRPGATRVTVVISPADPGTALGGLPAPTLHVTGAGGRPLARFAPPRPRQETVLLLAELYRRGGGWKLRALGQGYADGLAGLARDFGVDITEEAPSDPGLAVDTREGAPSDPDGFAGLVNAARASAGAPPVALDVRLTSAAREHALAMAARNRLDGEGLYRRVSATGYAYVTVGEHLVSGPRSPAGFVEYCLGSGRSRRTLLDPAFTHAGLACAPARSGDVYWTAVWARPFTAVELARTATRVVELTNRERAGAGLAPLAVDPVLTTAAQAHSADMVARAFYSHTCPDGSRPWDRAAAAGSRRRSIGENIACGQRSPAEVVRGWMNSPGHRANILKRDFTHIGVGFAGGGEAGTYWTQLFGA